MRGPAAGLGATETLLLPLISPMITYDSRLTIGQGELRAIRNVIYLRKQGFRSSVWM
jgi:hypothetical protein